MKKDKSNTEHNPKVKPYLNQKKKISYNCCQYTLLVIFSKLSYYKKKDQTKMKKVIKYDKTKTKRILKLK